MKTEPLFTSPYYEKAFAYYDSHGGRHLLDLRKDEQGKWAVFKRHVEDSEKLRRALEVIQAMATPVNTLPWEKSEPINFAKTMDAIAAHARNALLP